MTTSPGEGAAPNPANPTAVPAEAAAPQLSLLEQRIAQAKEAIPGFSERDAFFWRMGYDAGVADTHEKTSAQTVAVAGAAAMRGAAGTPAETTAGPETEPGTESAAAPEAREPAGDGFERLLYDHPSVFYYTPSEQEHEYSVSTPPYEKLQDAVEQKKVSTIGIPSDDLYTYATDDGPMGEAFAITTLPSDAHRRFVTMPEGTDPKDTPVVVEYYGFGPVDIKLRDGSTLTENHDGYVMTVLPTSVAHILDGVITKNPGEARDMLACFMRAELKGAQELLATASPAERQEIEANVAEQQELLGYLEKLNANLMSQPNGKLVRLTNVPEFLPEGGKIPRGSYHRRDLSLGQSESTALQGGGKGLLGTVRAVAKAINANR